MSPVLIREASGVLRSSAAAVTISAKPPRPACYVSGVQLLGAVDNHRIEAALDVAHRPCSSSSNSIRALALHSDMNIDKVDKL